MKTKKKLLIAMAVLFLLMIMPTVKVQAGYQSIGTGTGIKRALAPWMTEIRQMESSGQGLGLSEDINTTTLLSTTGSNNIDVHLQKNTEYGAVLLLGASDYGKQGATKEARYMNTGATTGTAKQASTTGNRYGVYEMGYYDMNTSNTNLFEWTAGGIKTSFWGSRASRYWDEYTASEASALAGDATTETKYWHGSSSASWVTSSSPAFIRGSNGAFSYYNHAASSSNYGRAVVVVGAGL